MTPRLYLPELQAGRIRLGKEQSHHLVRVLRLASGAFVVGFNGQGQEASMQLLAADAQACLVEAEPPQTINRESPLRTVVLQALCTGDKMDWVVQKSSELGASEIWPIQAERSVLRLTGSRAATRLEHWRKIAESAASQCGRNRLPRLAPIRTLQEAVLQFEAEPQPKSAWLLDPFADQSLSSAAIRPYMGILIGPEAGFSDEEEALARAHGFEGVRSGPRILRTETAAAAVLASLACRCGEF
jgi:16S rRNA (uracil1498-N3)-methyltransferase